MLYENHYICSECGTEWYDVWDCNCDDRCPNCDTSMEVTDFIELDVEGPIDDVLIV